MKKFIALALFVIAGGVLFLLKQHYQQPVKQSKTQTLNLSWTLSPAPIKSLSTPVQLDFSLKGERNEDIDDAQVTLSATMPHPGMAPVEAPVQNLGKGRYQSRFTLTMHGDWIVFLTIERKQRDLKSEKVVKTITFKTGPE